MVRAHEPSIDIAVSIYELKDEKAVTKQPVAGVKTTNEDYPHKG
jgi:hypothetical protein